MSAIAQLDELAAWMRKVGATRARTGDLELVLGDEPRPNDPPRFLSDDEAVDALKKRKEHRDKLLFASSEGFPDDEDT